MSDVIGIAASAAGGGLFGLIGTTLGRLAGFFEKRQSIAHEERRWLHELKLAEAGARAAAQQAEAALRETDTAGRWAGLQASLTADAEITESYRWVDAVRALTRPFLTVLLWGIATLIWFSSPSLDQVVITETATFAATAATLWWFGDRAIIAKAR